MNIIIVLAGNNLIIFLKKETKHLFSFASNAIFSTFIVLRFLQNDRK